MNSNNLYVIHTGTIIEDDTLTLEQLCNACGAPTDWVISLVDESIIEPDGEEVHSWRFSGDSLVRVRSALSLERDLGVNLPGIALALDLMEELERLRAQIKVKCPV
ncbi:MAG: MerR family transcriptional regulator [Methylobacter sp.]|nr:MAG: MerR family transcriptional regulator [Methylobacter sp.]